MKLDDQIKEHQRNEWEIKERYSDHVVMERRKTSVGVHIILFLFTWGLGNIVYYIASKETKKLYEQS